MPNPWVEHVRAYAKKNNISYMCAIGKASATYQKKKRVKKEKVKKEKVKKVKKEKVKKISKKEKVKKIKKEISLFPNQQIDRWIEKIDDENKKKKEKVKKISKKEKAVITFQSFYRGEKGRKKARNKKISKIVDEGQKLFKDLRELKGKIETLEGRKKGPKTIRKGKGRGGAPDYKYWNERNRKAHAKNPFTKQDNENLKTLRKDYRKEMKKEKYKKFYNSLTEKDKLRAIPSFYWGQY